MAKKRKRKQPYNSAPSKAWVIAGVFTATIVTALLSFISLELALLAFGFFALSAVTYSEVRRRQLWERAASFKFKTGTETQDTLSKKVEGHTKDIQRMQDELMETKAKLAGVKAQAKEDKPSALDFLGGARSLKEEEPPVPKEIKPAVIPPADSMAFDDGDYDSVSDTIVRELINNAVHSKRIDVFVQPIMRLPQRQVRFYELFARIRARAGQYLPAQRYMPIAEQDNLQHDIDNLLLLHCLKTISDSAHIEKAAPFFINITSSTLKNTAFMKRLLGFVSQNRDLAPRLVFEMAQNEFENMAPALLEIIRGLGTLGCRFSLDHVENFECSVEDLQRFKVRFVKAKASTFEGTAMGEKRFAELQKNKRKLEANGIGVIVEHLETEGQLRALLDFDFHYGQGYLFGKPDLEGAYKKRARARRMGLEEDAA